MRISRLIKRWRRIKTWHGWLPMAGQRRIGIWREPREWIAHLWDLRRETLLSGMFLQMTLREPTVISAGGRTWRLLPDGTTRCPLLNCQHRPAGDTTAYREDLSGDIVWWCLCDNSGVRFGTPLVDDEGTQYVGFGSMIDLPAMKQ